MMHLLGQTGGGGWFTPGMVKGIFWVIVVIISVLGPLFKKANEARAKRQAEQGQRRREEEALRTGRPAVDLSDTGEFEAVRDSAPSQSAKQATAEDARRKLQELAERRRRELAEMMRRAQGGSGSATSAPPVASPTPPTPPSMPRPRQHPQPQPQRPKQPRPQQSQPKRSPNPQQPARSMQEVEARRKRDAQAQREGANLSASRERAEEAEATRREAIAKIAKGAAGGGAKGDSAYDLPGTRRADSMSAAVSGASVGAAMARVGAGGKTASAAEWRKAIVLSELLNKPVGMREEGERVF